MSTSTVQPAIPSRSIRTKRATLCPAAIEPICWWRGWAPLFLLTTAAIVLLFTALPRWVVMWSIALALYAGSKWLTLRRTRCERVPLSRQLGYLLLWPGMDAAAFLKYADARPIACPTTCEWLFALAKTLVGLVLLFGVARFVPAAHSGAIAWVDLVGLAFAVHCGVFHVLSCAWRAKGVDARPLMVWPVAARGVSDFWGRRWNTAFRDLCYRFTFRPLTARTGPRAGMLTGFIASGLVHDLVISLPAGGGYGAPTLFFGLQGAALLTERSAGRRLGLGRGFRGWLFAAVTLLATVPLMFHSPFIREVMIPMLQAWRAIP